MIQRKFTESKLNETTMRCDDQNTFYIKWIFWAVEFNIVNLMQIDLFRCQALWFFVC